MMLNKKAAMFGLDARIALAIFGALSVITGAALFSALEKAKYVSYQNQINEISKAIEQYMLDTRKNLPIYTTLGVLNFDYRELFSSSVNGWNGPYLKGLYTSTIFKLSGSDTSHFKIKKATDVSWTAPESEAGTGNGTCGNPCYYWIEMGLDVNYLKKLDMMYDKSSDYANGNFRIFDTGSGAVGYYKVLPIMN